ncbi:Uncharacterized protein YsdA [Folsomia candida]|uniref:Uncharacterized protein YsdA n=1 Tax=Folsomia candida TaxID=158441 RepID=A0A226DUT1_FOLCA|nr:Uncharacterized protein YsdA [Folsomia candida]
MDPILIILVCYAVLLLFFGLWTFSLMARDKRAAESSMWRISECKLHTLELFGGWFGSLMAQVCYRHKNKKCSYQIIFWIIVAAHVAGIGAVFFGREKIRDLFTNS